MSASVCALGHPLSDSQPLCPECGLGRLPSAPQPLGTAAADAVTPANAVTPAPEAAQPAPAPVPAPYAPPPAAIQHTPPSAATRYPPPSEAAQYTPAPEQLHYAATAAAPSPHWGQPAQPPPPAGPPYGHPGFGGSQSYPPVGYGAPAPQSSRRWIVVAAAAAAVVLIAGGALWWTHRTVGSATGKVQADGSTVVNSRGISITAPTGWTVVSTTQSSLAKADAAVAQSNPQLASAMQALQESAHNNDLRFFAYDTTAPGGFTNANVLVTTAPASVSAVIAATAADAKKAGAKHVHDSGVIAGGSNAVELLYQLPVRLPNGGEITIQTTQVFESKGSELGVLSIGSTTAADDGTSALINSFRLT